jgi:hypothetical protein
MKFMTQPLFILFGRHPEFISESRSSYSKHAQE